ncbi:MAG: stage II sporulation protein P [Clostridiales bacterium]|nr:stage II sporulation protein P [Clostridiales bacterium]
MKRWAWFLLGALLASVLLLLGRPQGPGAPEGSFYTLYLGSQPFLFTEIPPAVGDRFLSSDGMALEVVGREGRGAWLKVLGPATEIYGPLAEGLLPEELPALSVKDLTALVPRTPPKKRLVVIYHSHTDESYIPARGIDSEPEGGAILEVGGAFKAALLDQGFTHVVHDLTNFWPHDEGSYARSRRAVLEYLQERPLFLWDVHRDAGPGPEVYRTSYGGRSISQIMMVVGKGNPFYPDNLTFARSLMAVMESLFPGLIKGIFLAEGTYNQDLSPGALLLEVGNQWTPLEEAILSMDLFARGLSRWVQGLGRP